MGQSLLTQHNLITINKGEIIINIALLFEQSGTFKKQLQAIGHNAKDFDICNDYGETDYIVENLIRHIYVNGINLYYGGD